MTILSGGKVLLKIGEPLPVCCSCGCIYQPPVNSECSDCPNPECNKLNIHGQFDWILSQ